MYLIYPIALSFHYLIHVASIKLLSNIYDYKKIMINAFLIAFLILLLLFPKHFISKPDFNYIFLILFSLNILFGIFIWYKGIIANINLGELEGLAIAIYLPILTFGSIIILKQKIKTINIVGICVLAFGAYLTLK